MGLYARNGIVLEQLWYNQRQCKKINAEAARCKFYPELDMESARKQITKDVASGRLDICELERVLQTPSKSLLAAKKIVDLLLERTLETRYPLLSKRISSDRGIIADCDSMEKMINTWHDSYLRLGLNGAEDMVDEAEEVLRYYKEKKERDKAAKKK